MKMNKKKLTVIVAVIFATTILVACMSAPISTATPEPTPNIETSPLVEIPSSSSNSEDTPNNDPEAYSIGNFTLEMTFEDARQYFPSNPNSDVIGSEGDPPIARTLTFDSLELMFIYDTDDFDRNAYDRGDYDVDFVLYSIEASSPEYVTSEGLSVGDDTDKLVKLYGATMYAEDEYEDNIWVFSENFSVTVEDGIVTKIRINLIM